MKKVASQSENALPPPLKELIRIIAEVVVEDYKKEILKKQEEKENESMPLRQVQPRKRSA